MCRQSTRCQCIYVYAFPVMWNTMCISTDENAHKVIRVFAHGNPDRIQHSWARASMMSTGRATAVTRLWAFAARVLAYKATRDPHHHHYRTTSSPSTTQSSSYTSLYWCTLRPHRSFEPNVKQTVLTHILHIESTSFAWVHNKIGLLRY